MSDRKEGAPAWRPPERTEGRPLRVVWPKLGRPIDATLAWHELLWVPVHWTTDERERRHTALCVRGAITGCPLCDEGKRRDWRGHLPAIQTVHPWRVLLVFGEETAATIGSLVPPDGPLERVRVVLERTGGSEWGPVAVRLSMQSPLSVPSGGISPWPTLRLLYGRQVDDYAWTGAPRKGGE